MITTLLIDDEEHNNHTLRTLLEKHCPGLTIIGEAKNAEEAFLKINSYRPRLIFLDIKMPKKNGFDLLKMFPEINFEVIFVTAFNKYAIKAFEFNALGYILKPIDTSKLVKMVEVVSRRIQADNRDDLVLHFVKTLSDTTELVNKLPVHHNGKVMFINIHDILSIEAKGENVTITLQDNTHYFSSKRLTEFEVMLESIPCFLRINKSVIINTSYIKSYTKGEPCIIDMKNMQLHEVSRRRKSDIIKKLHTI